MQTGNRACVEPQGCPRGHFSPATRTSKGLESGHPQVSLGLGAKAPFLVCLGEGSGWSLVGATGARAWGTHRFFRMPLGGAS